MIGAVLIPFVVFIISVVVGLITVGWPTLIGNLMVFISCPVFLIFGKLMVVCRQQGSKACFQLTLISLVIENSQ